MNLFSVNEKTLLPVPWKSMNKSWNEASLMTARKNHLAWENLYPDYRKKVRHTDPTKKPKVPTFVRVEKAMAAPMIALGGKIPMSSNLYFKNFCNFHNTLLATLAQACDMALHFTSRLVQHMVVNARKLAYAPILFQLRTIAECWSHDKADMLRMIEIINEFKQLVRQGATIWQIWQLIARIEAKASSWLIENFMRMLNRNKLLEYSLLMPKTELENECLEGEHSFTTAELKMANEQRTKAAIALCKHDKKMEEACWLLLSVTTHKQVMTLPIRWEGSMAKVSTTSSRMKNCSRTSGN